MTSLKVKGGGALGGHIHPSANKNAVLPILCATLLTEAPITLRNVPDITDVRRLVEIFRELGSNVDWDIEAKTMRLEHRDLVAGVTARSPEAMRAAVLLVPGFLHRLGTAALQGTIKGCTLGARELDPHIEVFRAFGAAVDDDDHRQIIALKAPPRFAAADLWLEYASVTTSENFILCAVVASGVSRLTNAACEPHVQELCGFLTQMGARITGTGTSSLSIEGVRELGGVDYTFWEDFHEIATFLALGAASGGAISVDNRHPEFFPLIDRTFAKFGAEVVHEAGMSRIEAGQRLKVRQPFTDHLIMKVEAAPWPYIPADLLPIFIALGVRAEGQTMFWNKVYEGALTWHTELALFGAHTLMCDPHRLITFGGKDLRPATVTSPYIIRVAIALLMIATSIEGESVILDADPIRRAHPRFVENLIGLGAEVEWVG